MFKFETHCPEGPNKGNRCTATTTGCAVGECMLRNAKHQYVDSTVPDDAQAMALVKKFKLSVGIKTVWKAGEEHPWQVEGVYRAGDTINHDLNKAIGECVAKMQVDGTDPETSTRSADGMSDTPRTDALVLKGGFTYHIVGHARQLERELSAAESKVDALTQERDEAIAGKAMTPRTDAVLRELDQRVSYTAEDYKDLSTFTRQLEREVDALMREKEDDRAMRKSGR